MGPRLFYCFGGMGGWHALMVIDGWRSLNNRIVALQKIKPCFSHEKQGVAKD